MKKAIILCAGRGKRFGQYTDDLPKPLVQVNGTSIIENTIKNLIEANYSDIVMVVGYKKEKFKDLITKYEGIVNFKIIENSEWEFKNNIYSLWLAREEMNTNFTLIEGDFYFNRSILDTLECHSTKENTILISPLNNLMEGLFIEEPQNGRVQQFLDTKKNEHVNIKAPFKVANIFHISLQLALVMIKQMKEEMEKGNYSVGYEYTFKNALKSNIIFNAIKVPVEEWYEIDNSYDLSLAQYQFSENKYNQLSSKHGGYWRFNIKDFALIYNFHFPPDNFKDKMKERFDSILLNYPSTLNLIIKQLSNYLRINEEHLIVSNGTSEIIKILPRVIKKKVLLTEPSFNEYQNCFPDDRSITFELKEENDFDLDIPNLIRTLEIEQPEALILNTPNNPTGRIISKETIKRIYNSTNHLKTLLILDESFLDFSSNGFDTSFLNELEEYPRIVILKSMSKTFGIGGIRLGYVATANKKFLDNVRDNIPIWNINSLAEEFIFNLPPYENDYSESCQIVREETQFLVTQLKSIDQLKVFDTEANFVLCKITDQNITALEFAETLLDEYSIYIKECSGKNMQDSECFLRISSRTKNENAILVESIKRTFEILNKNSKSEVKI